MKPAPKAFSKTFAALPDYGLSRCQLVSQRIVAAVYALPARAGLLRVIRMGLFPSQTFIVKAGSGCLALMLRLLPQIALRVVLPSQMFRAWNGRLALLRRRRRLLPQRASRVGRCDMLRFSSGLAACKPRIVVRDFGRLSLKLSH